MKITKCGHCGQFVEKKPVCTICHEECSPYMWLAFGHFKKKYAVCNTCWLTELNLAVRALRKKKQKTQFARAG